MAHRAHQNRGERWGKVGEREAQFPCQIRGWDLHSLPSSLLATDTHMHVHWRLHVEDSLTRTPSGEADREQDMHAHTCIHRDTTSQLGTQRLGAGMQREKGERDGKRERERELNYIESLEPLRIVCSIRIAF